jgi:hypothetical protein
MNENRKTDIKLICPVCKTTFPKEKRYYNQNKKLGHINHCSKKCGDKGRIVKQKVICKQCGANFLKWPSQIKATKNNFCNSSCAATYNNLHKTHGTRTSKLEIWLTKKLPKLYPSLKFYFNRKDAINSELDIYIPSLKLAFELNGIFHYEPIYGEDKLSQIMNNDNRKFQACLENGIELCTIDVSKLKYFKDSNAQPYLNIITDIINLKL